MQELFAAFGINWKLLLIQAINFGLLLLVLWYFLYRPVLSMIDERRKKIAEGVENAEEAERKLAAAKGEGEDIVGRAVREGEEIVSQARKGAEEKGAAIVAQARAKADAAFKESEQLAAESQRRMREAATKDIVRAAALAAEKVLRGSKSN